MSLTTTTVSRSPMVNSGMKGCAYRGGEALEPIAYGYIERVIEELVAAVRRFTKQ